MDRYSRRRRWIVGGIAVTIAVVIMFLVPSPRLAQLFFKDNVYWTRKSNEESMGFKDTFIPTTEVKEIPTIVNTSSPSPSTPPPTPSIFTYVEEPPTGNERKRLMRALSTQGIVCWDQRRIGGKIKGSLGPDGMWYVCFDEEVQLQQGSCVVYSVGIGNDFSFDEKMENYGCSVFSFDPTMNKEDHNHSARVMFYNLGLSDVNQERTENVADKFAKRAWKTRTLATLIKELGHTEREIDILKMDIEADEWKCLPHMLADGTLKKYVRQMNVEYHVTKGTPEALRRYYSIAKWLERQGFKIFHYRRNAYCAACWEMAYINSNLVNLPLN